MEIYLVNNDSPAARSLMVKLAGKKQPGEMVPCSQEEMDAYRNGDFIRLTAGAARGPIDLIPVEPDQHYIAVVHVGSVGFDDVVRLIDTGILPNLSIIRVRE